MPVAPLEGGSNKGLDKGSGIAFLVASGIVYEIIAAACSSPQTTELNADIRAETLMKWVHIGLAQSVLFVGIAVFIDPNHKVALATGGGLAAALQYGCYMYAKKCGLDSSEPPTENWTKSNGR